MATRNCPWPSAYQPISPVTPWLRRFWLDLFAESAERSLVDDEAMDDEPAAGVVGLIQDHRGLVRQHVDDAAAEGAVQALHIALVALALTDHERAQAMAVAAGRGHQQDAIALPLDAVEADLRLGDALAGAGGDIDQVDRPVVVAFAHDSAISVRRD